MSLLLIILLIALVVGLPGGYYYGNRTWGPTGGFSIVGVLLLFLVLYLFLGHRL